MNNEWYIFNDSKVGPIEFSNIFKKYNYINYKYVYNLFYQKLKE